MNMKEDKFLEHTLFECSSKKPREIEEEKRKRTCDLSVASRNRECLCITFW